MTRPSEALAKKGSPGGFLIPERILTVTPTETVNRAQLAYDILLDIADYQSLYNQRNQLSLQEFARKKPN